MDLQLHMPLGPVNITCIQDCKTKSTPHLVDLMLIDLADGMLDFTTFPFKIFNLKETKVYEYIHELEDISSGKHERKIRLQF